jgi:hypothetical protein
VRNTEFFFSPRRHCLLWKNNGIIEGNRKRSINLAA